MRTESRRWLWVVVAGFPLPPSPSSPPSSCLLLSAASRAERSLAGGSLCPPARLFVCLVCLARSLPPSLALALPACLSPSPPPPPLPLRARLTFAAHHPEPQGGARARHAGTCSLRPAARRTGRAGPRGLLRRRGSEPAGILRSSPDGGSTSLFTNGCWSSPRLGMFPTFVVPCGDLWLEWRLRVGVKGRGLRME